MAQVPFDFLVGDKDFYTPLQELRSVSALAPARVPDGWRGTESDIWTFWHLPAVTALAEDGWKVHVSAARDRVQHVLDTAAALCFEEAVPFKHLSTREFYDHLHHRFASRPQAGKFIAAYPPHVEAARRLMERLREALAGEQGPRIMTDRAFQGSKSVYYRYGGFVARFRVEGDGTRTTLVRDGAGRLVPDRRETSFHLPDGITDPFAGAAAPSSPEPSPKRGGSGPAATTSDLFNGFAVTSSVRYSNAGGTYRGVQTATGRRVFIKEGRPDTGRDQTGLSPAELLRCEWQALTALHALAPGLAPQPLSYFRVCGHDYLVTEHVDGILLTRWLAANHPLLQTQTTAPDFAAYYERCERIIGAIELALDRLHAAGYAFVDVSPGNVLVGADDAVRLVDFGAAHRFGDEFVYSGTPGYAPPVSLVGDDPTVCDHYGLSALALLLLGPLHQVAQRYPGALAHLHHDIAERAPVPPSLWEQATRYLRHGTDHAIADDRPASESQPAPTPAPVFAPTPEQVSADLVGCLAVLRDQIADALVAMTDLEHPTRVFPTTPQGLGTNTVCLAYGTAGVVHALYRAGRPLPDGLLDRLRRDALDAADRLGPGLYAGTAGIAAVLADRGLLGEARGLLDTADRHPLTGECATLFGGSAGLALAHLALYGHTRDEHHVDRALALTAALPADDALTPFLGPDDATGLLYGRCGIALMLQQLAGVTGEERHLSRSIRLLHAELDRASDPDAVGLQFPVSAADNRVMPYFFCGSAGMAFAVTRCVQAAADERLSEALPRLLAALRCTYTIMPGLYQGTAGLAFTFADHAVLHDDDAERQAALHSARGLFKFAIPHATGTRLLGDQLHRYSAELWSGSAGVLLALSHVLDPRPDALFTVDALIGTPRPAVPLATRTLPTQPR